MAAKWIETITGSLEQKKQYKQDKARIEGLPEPYATAAKAMHRYVMYYGGITDGDKQRAFEIAQFRRNGLQGMTRPEQRLLQVRVQRGRRGAVGGI